MDNKAETAVESTNVQVISIHSICRLCSSTSDRLINVFADEGLTNNLADKINSYLPIKIAAGDDLPQQCCLNCTTTLLAWHELVQAAVETDKKLRETPFLTEKNIEEFEEHADDKEMPADPSASANFAHSDEEEGKKWDGPKIRVKNLMLEIYPTNEIDYIADINEEEFMIDPDSLKYELNETVIPNKIEEENNEQTKSEQAAKPTSKKDPARKHPKIDMEAANAAKVNVDGRSYWNCKECGKSLHSPYTYMWHMRIHTGERPYVCDLCGKKFRVSQGLVRHLRETHQGIKKFPCDLCGRMFATRRNVEEHRRIHTNERPYVCDLCGKSFKQKASLFVHKRSHRSYKPFKCNYCNQGFRTKPPLMVHITRHTGEKPYMCDICGRCFRIKYELKRHRLIHSDEKPFTCSLCGLSFKQNRYLRNHLKSNHNLTSTTVVNSE